jgi:hypothetical protein
MVIFLQLNASLYQALVIRNARSMAYQRVASTGEILTFDLARIGQNSTGNPFIVFQPTALTFAGDVDNNGSTDTVRYVLTSSKTLTRGFQSSSPYPLLGFIENLQFRYLNANGIATTTADSIKSIAIRLLTKEQAVMGDTLIMGYWESTINPPNL